MAKKVAGVGARRKEMAVFTLGNDWGDINRIKHFACLFSPLKKVFKKFRDGCAIFCVCVIERNMEK